MMKVFSILAGFIVSLNQAKLTVYGPDELLEKFSSSTEHEKAIINANYANFGHIPYGQSLIGSTYFDESNPLGCKKFDPTFLDSQSTSDSTETFPTKILIV